MSADWDAVLLAYLHDPPDKALDIPGHVERAGRYAEAARNEPVESSQLQNLADSLASQVERLPAPHWRILTVAPQNGALTIFHPLSAQRRDLKVGTIDQAWVIQHVRNLTQGLNDSRRQFLVLWRFFLERLADADHPWYAHLPADTRTPDHTIWHHLDITSGLQATEDTHGRALLAFALGPVQRFIEAARTVRDLWSGSMILSWLAFRAMRPILEQFGPTAFIYPALRGIPLVDLWLRQPKLLGESKVPLPGVKQRRAPSLPHRFLALVPWGANGAKAKALAIECQQAAKEAVRELADAVHGVLDQPLSSLCADWDKRWQYQVENYFSFAAAVVPLGGSAEEVDTRLADLLAGQSSFAEAFPEAEAVRNLARAIPPNQQPGYPQDHAGRWQYQVELVQRSLAAHRTIRHVPPNPAITPGERFPQKCTLLGSFEQMGPDDLSASRQFWDMAAEKVNIHGVRIRPREGLCAVALMKRFAGPALLAKELQISPDDLRFPDTWTVAAAEWLVRAQIDPVEVRRKYGDWNGQWLHWHGEQDDPDEPRCPPAVINRIKQAREAHAWPPIYYAILKLDGDNLGGWLRGENSPKVREVMHPDLVRYYEGLGAHTKAGLDAKRPVGPALHAAISTALTNFALHVVPDVVAEHHGTVIYSGGDDTLALLPVSTVLACVRKLQQIYTSDWYTHNGREYLMMGSRATLSGGIVLVHATDNLRLALQDARAAEHQAKEAGRDALAITVRRRSGEHTTAVCPWTFVERVQDWVNAFWQGTSDRWAYHLYAERQTLTALPPEAIQAEMRRQLQRAEQPTPRLIPPDQLLKTFQQLRDSAVEVNGASRRRFASPGEALENFLTLCQSASFLARGRDE
ncbi:MAG: type III-B CRISPR-associated protein Cas10/Cmr2 [Thermogemmata sp.]